MGFLPEPVILFVFLFHKSPCRLFHAKKTVSLISCDDINSMNNFTCDIYLQPITISVLWELTRISCPPYFDVVKFVGVIAITEINNFAFLKMLYLCLHGLVYSIVYMVQFQLHLAGVN